MGQGPGPGIGRTKMNPLSEMLDKAIIDDNLPDNIVKFVNKDGSETVVNLKTGKVVIDVA